MDTLLPDDSELEMLAALRRAALYRALARAFAYPKGDTWDDLLTVLGDVEAADLAWPEQAAEHISAARQELLTNGQETTENEYFRLFGPAAAASPHETAYGDPGRMMAKAAHLADISGFYLAFGLAPRSGGETNLEDHLTMELEFMSLLNAKEAMAMDEGWQEHLATTQQAQQSFLRDHLGIWVHVWREKLLENQPAPFYVHMTALLLDLIEAEAARLDIEPVRLRQKSDDLMVGGESMECPMAGGPPEDA